MDDYIQYFLGSLKNPLTIALACVYVEPLYAVTTTNATIGVSATLSPSCEAGSAGPSGSTAFGTLNFGTQIFLTSAISTAGTVSGSGAIRVKCNTGVAYRVLLSGGNSNNTANRYMTNPGGGQIYYNLYSDSGFSNIWNNSLGVSGIANGADQLLFVYGRVPAQATPAPGQYSDTIIVTINW